MPSYRRLATVLASFLLTAPLLAQQAPAFTPAQLQADAVDAYVYGYPLVLMNATRQRLTNVPKPIPLGMAPANQFGNTQSFPDETVTAVVSPNADTLYSQVWLDLSQGPEVLSVGDMGGRYFLLPMMDAWTNVFASPGTRTTGDGPQTYLISGPGWAGDVPAGMKQIKSPTAMVWLLGRIQTNGKADFKAVQALQQNLKIRPLSAEGNASYVPAPGKPDPDIDIFTPPVQRVDQMDAAAFFASLAALMGDNPPTAADALTVGKLLALGIVPGQPYDLAKQPAKIVQAIDAGYTAGKAKVAALARTNSIAKHANGWLFVTSDIGAYGSNYDARAGVARVGLGANIPADAVYYSLRADAQGKPLNGSAKYVLHFGKGQLPPAKAFWSLAMYNDKQFFAANPMHRYAIGDRDALAFNPDGSLDLYVQHDSPGPAKEANWLPAPAENFNMILRVYWPTPEVFSGAWTPPALASR